jgi:hypothetical protein
MPEQPHNMDKLLKSYAEQRRAQAESPWRLDALDRNRLQAEVARTWREAGSDQAPRPWRWAGFLPGYVLAGSGVLVLLVAAVVWMEVGSNKEVQTVADENHLSLFVENEQGAKPPIPGRPESFLSDRMHGFELGAAGRPKEQNAPARAQFAHDAKESDSAAAVPSLTPTQVGTVQNQLEQFGRRTEVALAESPSGQAPVEQLASNSPRFSLRLTTDHETEAVAKAKDQPAPAAPAAPVTKLIVSTDQARQAGFGGGASSRQLAEINPHPASRFQAANLATQGNAQSWRFQQIDRLTRYRKNLNSPPAPAVLSNFEMQRLGQSVRFVDSDGSVYAGPVQAVGRAAPQVTPVTAQANADQSGIQTPGGFYFRAVGTNLTLNQRVEFTGDFQPQTQLGQAPLPSPAASPVSQANLQQEAQAVGVGRIQGSASIGGKNELKVEALQVGP